MRQKILLCLTQTSRKENNDLLKELEPAKAGLAKVGPKGLNRWNAVNGFYSQFLCVMILCIQVLYIINARIRIVQNFVDRPSASTSSASSWGVFVLLYKAFTRAKFYNKQGNPVIRFYKQKYAEKYVILLNVRNIFQGK